MENTADLVMVQKTITDTPTKKLSHRGSLLKAGGGGGGGGCSRSAVSKHIKYKVDWKEEIG